MIRRLLFALPLILVAGAAHAACTLPFTLLNGTLADATQVMANFNALSGCVNAVSITANNGLTASPNPLLSAGTIGLATIANNTALGNVAGVTAVPVALSKTQVTTLVNVFTDTLSGAAPAGGGVLNTFLEASTHAFQPLPTGSTSVFGVYKVDGTTITAPGGVLSTATGGCFVSGAAGIISNNGSNACVTDTLATLASGVLSLGTSGTAGAVFMANDTSGLLSIGPVNGVALGSSTATFPANAGMVAELNLKQSWTAAQRGTPVNIAISTSTFTPNFDGANHFEIDLTSACPCTLANPSTALVAGQSGTIEIHQDGSGSRTIGTWGSDYQYVGGTATIVLSTAASAVDYLSYYVNNAATGIVLGSLLNAPAH